MEIKIELDLQSIISSVVSAEKIQPLLEKAILDAFKTAISEATGYRSKFSEELKKQLAEAMPHGLSIVDVAKFQHMLNTAVNESVYGENAKTINEALRRAAEAVIPSVPTRIKLSDLLAKARENFCDEETDAFYAHLNPSEYGGGWLYLDGDAATREKYQADINLAFNKDGEVYALRLNGTNITPKSAPTVISGFEGILLSMYVGRTSLEIDMDEDEVEEAALDHSDN